MANWEWRVANGERPTPTSFGRTERLSALRRPSAVVRFCPSAIRHSLLAIPLAIPLALLARAALAQETTPANTLADLSRQFGACVSVRPLGPEGSRITIAFMMKRDGSIFGKPRITYAHFEGDAEAKARFLDEAARAVAACLPLKVTPALGGAIAGRMFTITLGREKPMQGI